MLEALVAAASVCLPAVRSDMRHKQELHHAQALHAAEAAHARRLLDDKLAHKARIFSTESVLATRRHALGMEVAHSLSRREALRDAWQQRSWFLQTMILTVALIFSVVFVALTQGRVAEIAQSQFSRAVGRVFEDKKSSGEENVSLSHAFGVHVWMGSMGVAIGTLFVSLWLCLLVQRRVGRYRVLPSLADAGSHGAMVARAGGIPKSVAGRRSHAQHDGGADLLSSSGNLDDLLSSPGRGGGGLHGDEEDDGSLHGATRHHHHHHQHHHQKHQPIAGGGGGAGDDDDDNDDDAFSIPSPQQQNRRHSADPFAAAPQQQQQLSGEAAVAGLQFAGGNDEPEDYASAAAAGEAMVDDVPVDDEVRSVIDFMMHEHKNNNSSNKYEQQESSPSSPPDANNPRRHRPNFETSSPLDAPPRARPRRRTTGAAAAAAGEPTSANDLGVSSPSAFASPQLIFTSPTDTVVSSSTATATLASPGSGKVQPAATAAAMKVVQLRDVAAADLIKHLQSRGPTALENDDGGRGDGGADKEEDDDGDDDGKNDVAQFKTATVPLPPSAAQPQFRYSCGNTHSDFNGYYNCHCEPLRRAAAFLLALGTSAATVAAAALHSMIMVDVFWHDSPAIIVAVLVAAAVVAGAIVARAFPDDLLESSEAERGDFMGLAENFSASA